MKPRTVTLVSVSLVAAALMARAESSGSKGGIRINLDEQPAPKTSPAKPAKDGGAPSAPATTPTKSSGPKKAPKEEPKPAAESHEMEGQVISRGEHGFLGVKVDGGFRVRFYDKDKNPVKADVDQIVLRWPVHYQPNDERTVLVPSGDGTVMTSERVVRAPYSFKLYMTLLKNSVPDDAETHVIDFHQE